MCSRADSIFVSVSSGVAKLTWLLSAYLHDVITPRNLHHDVIKHAVPISVCSSARGMIFFCFYSISGCRVQKYHSVFAYMVMPKSDSMTSWHDYMTSQNSFYLYEHVEGLDR